MLSQHLRDIYIDCWKCLHIFKVIQILYAFVEACRYFTHLSTHTHFIWADIFQSSLWRDSNLYSRFKNAEWGRLEASTRWVFQNYKRIRRPSCRRTRCRLIDFEDNEKNAEILLRINCKQKQQAFKDNHNCWAYSNVVSTNKTVRR